MKVRVLAAFILIFAVATFAENTMSILIGPMWPSKNALIKNAEKKTAWNTAATWGISFDDKVIIGAQADYMWHVETIKATEEVSDIQFPRIQSKAKVLSFPISAYIALSPIPKYRLHPVAKVQVGYNSVVVKHSEYDENASEASKYDEIDGYYKGLLTRFGLDAVYDLGEKSSVFAGFHYQVSKVTRKSLELNMNAPMLIMGISVYY